MRDQKGCGRNLTNQNLLHPPRIVDRTRERATHLFVVASGRRIVDAYEKGLVFGRGRSVRLAKPGEACDFGTDGHREKTKKDLSTVGKTERETGVLSELRLYKGDEAVRR